MISLSSAPASSRERLSGGRERGGRPRDRADVALAGLGHADGARAPPPPRNQLRPHSPSSRQIRSGATAGRTERFA